MDDFEGIPGPALTIDNANSIPMVFLMGMVVVQAIYIYCMFSGCIRPFSNSAAQHLT